MRAAKAAAAAASRESGESIARCLLPAYPEEGGRGALGRGGGPKSRSTGLRAGLGAAAEGRSLVACNFGAKSALCGEPSAPEHVRNSCCVNRVRACRRGDFCEHPG